MLGGIGASLVQTFHFGNYPHVKRRYLYAQRLAWRKYERLVAVSEAQRRALIEHVWVRPERITTIYNGVADNVVARQPEVRAAVREEFGVPPNGVVAGCIATMTAQKGIPHLLEAAASVTKSLPHVYFIIVGGGPLFDEMRGRAAALNLGPGVRFTNWRNDAVRLLAGFDVLVSSSLWEGFAMVLLEGMAAAKPIVATDVGDNSVAVADGINGFVVPAGDSAALAKAIASAVADPVRLRQMGCASHERFTRTFTVARMVEQYAALYSAVCEQQQRSTHRA
jgi:glycosyltransferase involved in cell wall biosynthesis